MIKKLILLIGAPGSGKTTDAQKIAQNHENITAYSTGELLDAEQQRNSTLGKIIQQYKEKGELVPTSITLDTVFEAIKNAPTEIVLLDGFPREKEVINTFCDIIHNNHDIELDAVIEVRVSDEVAKQRYLANHNVSEAVFEKSLAIYKDTIAYIEDFYKGKNLLKVVDGEQPPSKVIEAIDTILQEHPALALA